MKYSGSCHCQKVRFEVEADFADAITCNCSICHRRGSVLAFVPEIAMVSIVGENNLSDYQFGSKTIHHRFCSTCGILPFGTGTDKEGHQTYAINLRCLDNFDLSRVHITEFDGKSR